MVPSRDLPDHPRCVDPGPGHPRRDPPEKPPDRDKPVTGGELKTWREKRGWSQREAATRLKVGNAAVSRAEARLYEPLGHKLRAAFETRPDLAGQTHEDEPTGVA